MGFARFHFRSHFLQHSGFRLVASDDATPSTNLYPGKFSGQVAARDAMIAEAEQPASSTLEEKNNTTTNVYETDELLNMYLGLHYPTSGENENVSPILTHENAPLHGLRFPQRVVQLLTSLDPVRTNNRALDIGCAVGGSSFELAKSFDHVEAFDFSESFIALAKKMQSLEEIKFKIPVEGDITEEVTVAHEAGLDADVLRKVHFFSGDACSLSEYAESNDEFGTFDGVVMANLLCRLPDPAACLGALPRLVNRGGVAVLVTPFTWREE